MDSEKIKDTIGDILVVEDEIISIKYLTEILDKEGYHIRPALDGKIALRSIEAKTPDLILMEIKLPDISGIELTKKLKEEEITKNIPIIFLSSIGETNFKVEAFESGGVDYITKPFKVRELTERIKIQLRISRIQQNMKLQTEELKIEIENRKKMELELTQSALKWKTTFNAMSDSVGIVDLNNKFIIYNDITPDIFLKSSEEINKSHCYELVHGTNEPIKDCPFERMKKSKKSEYMIFERNSKWFRVNVDPIFNDEGELVSAVHVVSDITKKYNIEKELIDNRNLLNFTQEITKVGGWKYKVKEHEMFWTDEMYLIHDIDINEIEDGSTKHIDEGIMCYDEKDRSTILEAFKKCYTQGIPYNMVFPFTTFKNRKLWIRTSAHAIKVNGKIDSVIGNILDITDSKNSEIELSNYRDHLEELVKERTEKLENQNAELEHFNELFVDREFRIKELKDRVKELEGKK